MSDLVAWLTKVLDEDERAAHAVKPLGEVVVMGGSHHPETFGHSRHTFASEDGYPRTLSDPEAIRHFARYEPAAVLADIKAKRAILEAHSPDPRDPDVCTTCGEPLEYTVAWPCETARLLASAYADRPGYDEAWA